MELQFFGGNCLKITTKKAIVIVDDNLHELGGKNITKPEDILLFTSAIPEDAPKAKLVINDPGEYEVSSVSITGISARSHTDEAGQHSATIFKIIAEDVSAVITGHIHPDLSNEQIEAIGTTDVLCIPIGDTGITLDGAGAAQVIRKVEPKIVIPTYFADSKLKYPVPVTDLAKALKELGMEASESLPKLKVKAGEFGESAKLIILEN